MRHSLLDKLSRESREAWEDIITTLRRGKTPNLITEKRKQALLELAKLLEEQ
ncbi:hypothetical protein H6F96_06295 [Microcoleus sp. FACHB-53]|nr:hypothetical protein [Microcoleus sp. FACHB-53]MBD2128921.1 hypothetical protein [Microcoleus sp. FACHB-1]